MEEPTSNMSIKTIEIENERKKLIIQPKLLKTIFLLYYIKITWSFMKVLFLY